MGLFVPARELTGLQNIWNDSPSEYLSSYEARGGNHKEHCASDREHDERGVSMRNRAFSGDLALGEEAARN